MEQNLFLIFSAQNIAAATVLTAGVLSVCMSHIMKRGLTRFMNIAQLLWNIIQFGGKNS